MLQKRNVILQSMKAPDIQIMSFGFLDRRAGFVEAVEANVSVSDIPVAESAAGIEFETYLRPN